MNPTDQPTPTPEPRQIFPTPGSIEWDEFIERNEYELEQFLVQTIREREKLREAADRMRVEAQPFVGYACDEPPTDCECQNCKLRRASRAYDALLSTLKP